MNILKLIKTTMISKIRGEITTAKLIRNRTKSWKKLP